MNIIKKSFFNFCTTRQQQIFNSLVGIIKKQKQIDFEVTLDHTFGKLGFDSLAKLDVISAVEEDLQINIENQDDVSQIKTLGDAVNAFLKQTKI